MYLNQLPDAFPGVGVRQVVTGLRSIGEWAGFVALEPGPLSPRGA